MSGYEHCMRHQRDEDRTRLRIFFYLQLLDALTTLVGMRLGLGEASPVVRWLMAGSPVMGLLISKAIAFALCGICFLVRPPPSGWVDQSVVCGAGDLESGVDVEMIFTPALLWAGDVMRLWHALGVRHSERRPYRSQARTNAEGITWHGVGRSPPCPAIME